jgi:hypothetical protein
MRMRWLRLWVSLWARVSGLEAEEGDEALLEGEYVSELEAVADDEIWDGVAVVVDKALAVAERAEEVVAVGDIIEKHV